MQISIHAPPRGATEAVEDEKKALEISIHAPPRGATLMARVFEPDGVFQFTPLREGRRESGRADSQHHDFNSRPSARGDSYFDTVPHKATKFQFTPLREGRPKPSRTKRKPSKFQFTPLREGRQSMKHLQKTLDIFQFTPLREGRRSHVANVAVF